MKKTILLIAITATLASCKTSEANYRAAYEKAVATHTADFDDTDPYHRGARRPDAKLIISAGDTIEVGTKMVSPVTQPGLETAKPQKFMVVAGQFKQQFNAFSMCKRLIANGYPQACVVQTAEPYYFIVASSFPTAAQAAQALRQITANPPFPLQQGHPFLLTDPRTK